MSFAGGRRIEVVGTCGRRSPAAGDRGGEKRSRTRAATVLAALWLAVALAAEARPTAPVSGGTDAVPPSRISAEASPEQDRSIERRLREIFAAIDGAEGVEVKVHAGVVELTGEVLSPRAREKALNLTRHVEGVVEVNDRMELVRDFRRRLAAAVTELKHLAFDAIGYLPLLAVSLVVFLFFWAFAVMLGRWESLFRRLTRNDFLANFVRQLAKLAIVMVGLLVAFELLDATALLGTVMGAAGLISLAIGFALRATVENYIAGILLSMKQPFVPNDLVVIEGHEGRVVRLTSRSTMLMTLDGNHVRIPNATVFNNVVLNYTRNPERRFFFDVGVAVSENLSAAQKLAAETLAAMDGVLDDPSPQVDVDAIGDFNVVLRVYGWVDQRRFEFLKVRSEAIRLVKEAFEARGVVMPEPTYTIAVRDAGGAQQGTPSRPAAGPKQAIDIDRRTEIERQIAEERRSTEEPDLLSADAPLE